MQRERLLRTCARHSSIAGVDRHRSRAVQRLRTSEGLRLVVRERRLEPAPTLAQVPAQVPESPDRADETQDSLVLARRREEGDRRADVVVVELESIEQLAAARRELGFGALGDLEKEAGVALAHVSVSPAALSCSAAYSRIVSSIVSRGSGPADASWTRFFSSSGPRLVTTSRSPSQTASAASIVQPPANTASREKSAAGRRRAGRGSRRARSGASVVARLVAGPLDEEPEPVSSGSSSAVGSNTAACAAASSIASGSRRGAGRSRPPCCAPLHGRARADRLCAIEKQLCRRVVRERRHRIEVLPVEPKRLAAGREQLELRCCRDERAERRDALEQVLEVVQHEQRPAVLQVVGEQCFGRASTPFRQVEARAIVATTSAGSASAASATTRAFAEPTPVPARSSSARRVFPTPPGPTSVTIRTSARSSSVLPAPARPRVRGAVSAAEAAFPRARPGGRGSGRARGSAARGDAAPRPAPGRGRRALAVRGGTRRARPLGAHLVEREHELRVEPLTDGCSCTSCSSSGRCPRAVAARDRRRFVLREPRAAAPRCGHLRPRERSYRKSASGSPRKSASASTRSALRSSGDLPASVRRRSKRSTSSSPSSTPTGNRPAS